MKNSPMLVTLVLLSACAIDYGPAGVHQQEWQLVRIREGGGAVLTPDVKAKYTLEMDALSRVNLRIDCNHGTGTWSSPGPGQILFGPLALTRAACPPGSLHDRIVKQLPGARSYSVTGNRLLLSFADGATYEFEPSRTMGSVGVP
jgi:para-nitrobenzyl esterase